jgi:hypothetical protein
MDQTTHTRKTRITEADVEKKVVVQSAPKRARLVKLKDSTRSVSFRIEEILCDECATAVAERRADGVIVICVKHRRKIHVTIIDPREKLSPLGEKSRVKKIRCDETGCAAIVAERRAGGMIVIRSRHHDETHVTIIEP